MKFWLNLASLAAGFLFVVNLGIYVVRQRRLRRQGRPTTNLVRRKITATGILIYALMAPAMLAVPAAPVFAPGSAFANWLRTDYAVPIYYVWCFVGFTLLATVLTLLGLPINKKP